MMSLSMSKAIVRRGLARRSQKLRSIEVKQRDFQVVSDLEQVDGERFPTRIA